MNSWAVSACYPQSTFYPLSDGPSIQNHRITMSCFRICSTCPSRSQARLCHCTIVTMSDRNSRTFELLRYALGGDRPSQTAYHALFPIQMMDPGYNLKHARVVFQRWLHEVWRPHFKASHLSYTDLFKVQYKAAVKVHGVFPSFRGEIASSQTFQLRLVSGGDSVAIVTPFVQVGTYPTRNFATLGPL